MNKLIEKLNTHKETLKENKFDKQNILDYLKEYPLEFRELSKVDNSTLIKIMYIVSTKTKFEDVISSVDKISDNLNRINIFDRDVFYSYIEFMKKCIENDAVVQLYRFEETYDEKINTFNKIKFPKELKDFYEKLFLDKTTNLFDFDAFNIFIIFCKECHRLDILYRLHDFIDIRALDDEINCIMADKEVSKEFKKDYKDLLEVVEKIKLYIDNLNRGKERSNRGNTRIINYIDSIISSIKNKEEVDIEEFKKYIKDSSLVREIIIYNENINNIKYNEELKKYEELKQYELNKEDELLDKYGINIGKYKIYKNIHNLEEKLKLINTYMNQVKEYSNVLIKLINDVNYQVLEKLVYLLGNDIINQRMILDLVDILSDENELNNYINNVLLLRNKFDVKSIYKYDEEVLFMDNNKLSNILNIYMSYGINFDSELYDYKFLLEDYSNIIDKFIEIGEYELIKNNPSLITNSSNIIIKRCSIYKALNNNCINESGKLRGSLRKESNFILNDEEVNSTILENYKDIICNEILEILNVNEFSAIEIDLSYLDSYIFDKYSYKFGNLVVSRNKLYKNLSKLLSSNLDTKYSNSTLLISAILYNYPKTINKCEIEYLRSLFDKEKKLMLS